MGERQRIALLVPSSNTIMENDLHAHLRKDQFTVHTGRMYLEHTTAAAERTMLDEHAPAAADLVATVKPDLLVFGCTSAGSLGGVSYDRKFTSELGARAGCAGIGVLSSLVDSVKKLGLDRIAVITPYIPELTESVAAGLATSGAEVVVSAGMNISTNVELARPTPEEISNFVQAEISGADIDGVVISCTNFRALEAAPLLSRTIDLPVITSNAAVLEAIENRAEPG